MPVDINDETLALDLIDEVGPDGQFIDSEHTLTHFHSRWYPTLIDRNNYDGWLAKGGQDLGQRAAAEVEHILAEHTPEPLPTDIQKRLREIVQRATAA